MQTIKHIVRMTALVIVAATMVTAEARADSHGKMLYLVEFTASDAAAPTSPEQAYTLLTKMIVPSLDHLAKDEKIKAGGLLVGARAGAFIMEAGSHDEVTAAVRGLPAWGVWTWKVTPLESFAHRAETEKAIVKELAAGK